VTKRIVAYRKTSPVPHAGRHIPPIGMHRADVIGGLPSAALSVGLDYVDLLERSGLGRDALDDPDNLIPFSATCLLLHEASVQAHCDDFGLRVGRHSGLESLGLVDILARTCATAGEGLACVVDHLNLTSGVSMLWLQEASGVWILRYALSAPTSMPTRQYYDGAMAISSNIIRDLCGPQWRALEVRFAHRKPDNVRAFHGFFRAPLRFDCREYAFVIDAASLRHRLPTANEPLRVRLAEQAEQMRRDIVADAKGVTRRLIRKLLAVDRCSIEHVARLMGVHRRTLDRRLDAEGTSFRAEVESVRRQLARELLIDTDLSIGEIADSLSYGSASSFSTAFLRWYGTSASEFRSRNVP
jgi:AraC-like DNA-binding protein